MDFFLCLDFSSEYIENAFQLSCNEKTPVGMFMCCPNWTHIGCCCGKHGRLATHLSLLVQTTTPGEKPATQSSCLHFVALRCQHNFPFFLILLLIDTNEEMTLTFKRNAL